MPNDSLIRDIGLDPNFITADFNASVGMARYYRRMRGSIPNAMALAASLFRRAAAHTLLLDTLRNQQKKVITDAISAYEALNNPYAYVLAAFTSNQSEVKIDRERNSSPQHVFQLLAMLNNERTDQQLRNALDNRRSTFVGVLGIPLDNYLRLYDALSTLTNEKSRRPRFLEAQIIIALSNIFTRYENMLADARRDEYHWEMLESPLHPAEPEVFAALTYTRNALQRVRQDSIVETAIAEADMRPLTRALLRGINDTFNPPLMA